MTTTTLRLIIIMLLADSVLWFFVARIECLPDAYYDYQDGSLFPRKRITVEVKLMEVGWLVEDQ